MNRKIKLFIFTVFICIISLFYINVNAEENKILINIDSPKVNENKTNKVDIYGWVMSDSPNTNIKIYVDEKEIEVSRSKREDVLNAIKGYGGVNENPTPGFITSVDLTEYSYGNHTIKLDVLDKDGKAIKSETRIFNKKVPSTLINIDSPKVNENKTNKVDIYGWVMSDSPNTNIKIYIDDKEIEESITRSERQDVINAIKGYGTKEENPTPGYNSIVDMTNYSYGNHKVKIVSTDEKGNLISKEERSINKRTPNTWVYVDGPQNNESVSNKLNISGWVMSDYKNPTIKIYIDDKEIEESITRSERQDVINAIKGYGTKEENPTPGYNSIVDMTNYSYGNHKVKIVSTDEKGNLISKEERSINKRTPNTWVYVDGPQNNESVSNKLNISGWVMSDYKNPTIKIYIDDKEINEEVSRTQRLDVVNAIKGYGTINENPKAGYSTTVDMTRYTYGNHKVQIYAFDSSYNLISFEERKITRRMPNTWVYVDGPQNNESVSNKLNISGWVMSDYKNPNIKIYIDDKEIEESITRSERQDVINAIKGYGTKEENPTPGYNSIVDMTNYSYGNHKVKIVSTDEKGNLISKEERKITRRMPNTWVYVDGPQNNESMSNKLNISGWVMSDYKNPTIKIYIDDKEINEEVSRTQRLDVVNAIKGYGTINENPEAGYNVTIDLNRYKYGSHIIRLDAVAGTNVISSERRIIENIRPTTNLCIDTPTELSIQKSEFNISGWIMTNSNNYNVIIYLDNKVIDANIERKQREDVLNAINGFDKSLNSLPGFNAIVNLKDVKDGQHIIRVAVTSKNDEIINYMERKINLNKYKGGIYLDNPTSESINETNELYVSGWSMSDDKDDIVKIYIDDQELTENINRFSRDDVIRNVSNYGTAEENPTPGFSTNLNNLNYSQGYHNLKVTIYNHLGEKLSEYSKKIYFYKNMTGIDVSKHQRNINWNLVKQNTHEANNSNKINVDFAMIRFGYRGYGYAGNMQVDNFFVQNINGAKSVGIKVGIYFVTQATNYNEGTEEAKYLINNLNLLTPGLINELVFPIALDVESTLAYPDGRADLISKDARTDGIRGFVDELKKYGMRTIVYANPTYLNNKIDTSRLNDCDIWLANYTNSISTKSSYTGRYNIWQYSDIGQSEGITGNVDLNIVM